MRSFVWSEPVKKCKQLLLSSPCLITEDTMLNSDCVYCFKGKDNTMEGSVSYLHFVNFIPQRYVYIKQLINERFCNFSIVALYKSIVASKLK